MSTLMQGWAAGITPECLIIQIRQLFMEGNVRIANINKVEFYSEQEARQGFLSAQVPDVLLSDIISLLMPMMPTLSSYLLLFVM
jgi:hypothetical protein